MRYWAGLLLCSVLAACIQAPVAKRPEALLQDQLFAAPTERIRAEDVFALSDDMKRYIRVDIATDLRMKGLQRGLIDALYKRGELQLEYESTMTRNAAQAFEARSGNCLSLVIMTSAFAKDLGLQVQYRSAVMDEIWSRSGDLYMRNGHVNITLGRRLLYSGSGGDSSEFTVDFLPPEELRGLRSTPVGEQTIVAMYMNNRAAEVLAQGRLDDAYGWVREAIVQDPSFMAAYNTLGVVYQRHGDLALAESAFRHVMAREPKNTRALANLAALLGMVGRNEESEALSRRLAQLEPYAPFHFFQVGQRAMAAGDYRAARDAFAREIEQSGHFHEFHFWLGVAYYRLGDMEQARKQLSLAMENSNSRQSHDLYAAKLAGLRQAARR
jgi:tetratricopeptide (TPR) repeat protein